MIVKIKRDMYLTVFSFFYRTHTMKRSSCLLLLLGLSFLLTNCGKHDLDATLQPGAKKLTGPQVNQLVAGSSLQMKGPGQTASVEFSPEGKLSGTNTIGEKDKGEWKVKGDELCLVFKKWGQGDVHCYQVTEQGKDYQLHSRKGMMAYDVSVLTAGQQSAPPFLDGGGNSPSSPPAPPDRPLLQSPALPTSPQAAADVDFIIRQSAQNCPGCNLAHAKLAGQSLIGANLQGANLTEADLSHTNLRRANLRGANLYRADLRQADLTGADLTGANLSEALRE